MKFRFYKEGETKFARFYYYDNENAVSWNLIQNKKRSPSSRRKMVFKNFQVYQWKSQQRCIYFPNLKKQIIFLKLRILNPP
jgi:hypothetical protein